MNSLGSLSQVQLGQCVEDVQKWDDLSNDDSLWKKLYKRDFPQFKYGLQVSTWKKQYRIEVIASEKLAEKRHIEEICKTIQKVSKYLDLNSTVMWEVLISLVNIDKDAPLWKGKYNSFDIILGTFLMLIESDENNTPNERVAKICKEYDFIAEICDKPKRNNISQTAFTLLKVQRFVLDNLCKMGKDTIPKTLIDYVKSDIKRFCTTLDDTKKHNVIWWLFRLLAVVLDDPVMLRLSQQILARSCLILAAKLENVRDTVVTFEYIDAYDSIMIRLMNKAEEQFMQQNLTLENLCPQLF